MKPIKFKEHNAIFGSDQPEYEPLHAYRVGNEEGEIVSCWRLSLKERFKILITGKIWMSLLGFHKPINPSYLTTNKKELIR